MKHGTRKVKHRARKTRKARGAGIMKAIRSCLGGVCSSNASEPSAPPAKKVNREENYPNNVEYGNVFYNNKGKFRFRPYNARYNSPAARKARLEARMQPGAAGENALKKQIEENRVRNETPYPRPKLSLF